MIDLGNTLALRSFDGPDRPDGPAASFDPHALLTPVADTPGDDSPQARDSLARSLIRPGQGATPEDTETVRQYMVAHFPAATMRLMQQEGIHVQVTRGSVARELPGLAGNKPRGYEAGGDWSRVVGTYDAEHRAVVIATQDGPNGSRRMPDGRDSGSVDALAHETGHGINYRDSVWHNVSNTDAFIDAYRQDATHGTLAQPYYHQDNDGRAGRDEAFAESFAMYTHDPVSMQRD